MMKIRIVLCAGLVLLGVTALLAFQSKSDNITMLNEPEYNIIVKVEGLHCSMCVRNCERSLEKLEAVETSSVQIEDGLALVLLKDGYEVTKQEVINAIENAGFKAGEFKRFPETIDNKE
ncbi:MAG: heavy metal-associated domain-containing protein [Candidatus Paceibacterota bacterium]